MTETTGGPGDGAPSIAAGSFLEGVERFSLASSVTGAAYEIWVAKAPIVRTGEALPGLLIVLDGNYCFGTAAETIAIQAATGEITPPMMVAVGTTGGLGAHTLRRLRDYTPGGLDTAGGAAAANPLFQALFARFQAGGLTPEQALGGAEPFQRFIETELLPALRARYQFDETDLGIAGHSAGGAFISHLLLAANTPFSKFIAGSYATIWYGDQLAELESRWIAKPDKRRAKVFLGVGGAEVGDPNLSDGVQSGIDLLRRLERASPSTISAEIRVFDGETHTSVLSHLLATGIRTLWSSGRPYSLA